MERAGADDPGRAPTFSVVICTYNRVAVLPKAIDTVLAQGYRDFELVVVDDGSTDGTRELVEALDDPRVRSVHQDNAGLGVARNTGVAAATGRYVVFLDDDDLAFPFWLERFAEATIGDPAVVCCGEVVARDDGTVLRTNLPGQMGPAFADYEGSFLAGTFVVRRDAYHAAGGYQVGLQHLHQYEFALRLLPLCRSRGWEVWTIREPLIERHAEGERREGPDNTRRLLAAMGFVLERHHDQIARSPDMLAQYHAIAGVAAARLGDYRTARRHLGRAVRAKPRTAKNWARLSLAAVPPVGRRVWRAEVRTGAPDA
jgi:glycosyltransferase involved in cell wall biosynthesis